LNVTPLPAIIPIMKKICVNKKALFHYEILDRFEAGLALKGTEAKSIREGLSSIAQSFGRVKDDELWLYGMDIPAYKAGSIYNHDPKRARKLLLHKQEIKKLSDSASQKGFTIVPLSLYFERGWAKIELALARGKTNYDKRDTIKKRESKRDMDRARGRKR
jgi:SsrA-binding protein